MPREVAQGPRTQAAGSHVEGRLLELLGSPSVTLAGEGPHELGEGFAAVVRVAGGGEGAVLVLLEAGVADRETTLAEAATIAEACLGVSPSRFTNLLPRDASDAAIESALQALAEAQAFVLPPPSQARLHAVARVLREKSPAAVVYARAVRSGVAFHVGDSRDVRSGRIPGPMQHAASLSLVARTTAVRTATIPDPADVTAKARRLFEVLEAAARRPIRAAFASHPDGRLEPLYLVPTKRVGACSFALAADLLRRGALPIAELRTVLDEGDVGAAAPLGLDLDGAEVLATGLGAGPGTAAGHACFSHSQAAELAAEGRPAILFVHEVTRDDADALRLARGVVTVRGGLTGEAAIMSRALAKPCIASGATMTLDAGEVRTAAGRRVGFGDRLTLDGKAGLIVAGSVPRTLSALPDDVRRVIDALPTRGVFVRATHAADLTTAQNLAAEGVHLAADAAELSALAASRGLVVTTEVAPNDVAVRLPSGRWVCDPDAVLRARILSLDPP